MTDQPKVSAEAWEQAIEDWRKAARPQQSAQARYDSNWIRNRARELSAAQPSASDPVATTGDYCKVCGSTVHGAHYTMCTAPQPSPQQAGTRKVSAGDYVLATKYADGDPADHWCVGFYDCEREGRHYVKDSSGSQIRANGFRRVGRIGEGMGRYLLEHAKELEQSPPGTNLWTIVESFAANLPAGDEGMRLLVDAARLVYGSSEGVYRSRYIRVDYLDAMRDVLFKLDYPVEVPVSLEQVRAAIAAQTGGTK